MQPELKNNPSTSLWTALINYVIPSSTALKDLSNIRRAQLVMSFSLVIGFTCLSAAVSALLLRGGSSSALITFSIAVLGFLAYGIGRTHYYKWAAWLLVTSMAGAGYLLFARNTSSMPALDLFIMLPMALTLAAGLLSVREQFAFLLVNVIFLMILPYVAAPGTTEMHYAGIMFSLGILLIVVSDFLSRVERDQLLKLDRANQELNAVKDNLEELVKVGTESADAARAEAAAAFETLQERTWFLNAEVVLTESLRGQQDLAGLAKHSMQALCEQTEIPVGAFYLFTDGRLEFLGGFAYLPNEHSPSYFQLGEGLVGQAAVERRKIFLKNIPAGYFDVISGLGDALPSQLILLPCVYNQKLIGVIELGLLHDLSDTKMQFLDAAVENISIGIQTAIDRLRISELLTETQAQAEELQSREEELRAINEELEVQAESLRQVSNRTP